MNYERGKTIPEMRKRYRKEQDRIRRDDAAMRTRFKMIDTANVINKRIATSTEDERCHKCLKPIIPGVEHIEETVADLDSGNLYTRRTCIDCHTGESDDEFLNIIITLGVVVSVLGLAALIFMGKI